jgi:enoyl-CoA hydratase/carnithine racemase
MSVLLSDRQGEILVLTLNRPAVANALDSTLQEALVAALAEAATDESVRAVVLTASGERVFSAGADLKEYAAVERPLASRMMRGLLHRTLLAALDFPKPLVAAVQAKALGAGCMLAAAADEVIASEAAQFGLPEIRIGMPTPIGFAVLAPRLGHSAAQRLVQTGDPVDAARALAMGLADEVVAPAQLAARALERARALGAHPAPAWRANKAWINGGVCAAIDAAAAEAERLQNASGADGKNE